MCAPSSPGLWRCWRWRGLPAFLFRYPHNVLVLVRLFSAAACLCSLLIWRDARAQFQRDSAFTLVAVFLLFCLLAVVLSLWFLAQKFFYVKLDAALCFGSIVCLIAGMASACSVSADALNNDLFYLILCHIYLFIAQLFSLGWCLLCTRDSVSKLFISNWGQSATPTELEMLEEDF